MNKDQRFLKCKECGNLIGMIHDSGVEMICCGVPMTELVANTTEAATEKHIPVVEVDNNVVTVTIGSVLHPMLPEHHIEWVYLITKHGRQRRALTVGKDPVVTFPLEEGDKVVTVYEYCNLHGLWKLDV